MPRIAYVILCSCLLAIAGLVVSPAFAGSRDGGSYRDDGYYREADDYRDIDFRPHRIPRVWYSSSCCYRKIVRHVGSVRQVRYVKVPPPQVEETAVKLPYARPAHLGPSKQVSRGDSARHVAKYEVIVVRHDRDHAPVRERCRHKRVRVLSGDGGTVWALTARCY